MSLPFLKNFRKELDKLEDVITTFDPPTFWYSIGNYAANKTISGSLLKGVPQGRITCLAGPSQSGKSFLLCNLLRNAQNEGAFVLALDSENALDVVYMGRIGMKLDEDSFQYAGVTTFSDCVTVISDFIKAYVKEYGYNNPDAPKVVIALDSIDMLLTDTENEHFNSGTQKGDQGQRAKQAKHMLRTVVSRIKRLPMAFLVTHQVYPNTDITNGQGMWIINNAIKYSASQIVLITALKLKDGAEIKGVRMRVEAYKSRFAKPGMKVEIEVPYDAGMNKYSGFIELMEEMGVVSSAGAWKKLNVPGEEQISFQTKNLDDDLFKKIMSHPILAKEEFEITELMGTDSEQLQ